MNLAADDVPLVPQYANGLAAGFAKLSAEEGIAGLYAGFLPLLCKQIPYAIGQFTVNEFCHELALKGMSEEDKANLGGLKKLGIDLGSGITAGAAAAVLSHVSEEGVSNDWALRLIIGVFAIHSRQTRCCLLSTRVVDPRDRRCPCTSDSYKSEESLDSLAFGLDWDPGLVSQQRCSIRES